MNIHRASRMRNKLPSFHHHHSSFSFRLQRLQSTHSNDHLFKFINASFCMGKPISEVELQEKKTSEKKNKLTGGYSEWVQIKKKEYVEVHMKRDAHERGPAAHERLSYSGQDWWLMEERNHETFLGVADGVGGWLDSGVDPAQVSQGLMFHAHQIINTTTTTRRQADSTPSILTQAYASMLDDEQILGGASTCLLAKLDGRKGHLEWSNLGDSSIMLIRLPTRPPDDAILFKSTSQTHYFNCPYQLTKFPKKYDHDLNSFVPDTPNMANSGTFQDLQDGDLILLSTDGLGDNLFPQDIVRIIHHVSEKKFTSDDQFVQALATAITVSARLTSYKNDRVSPFEIEARKNKIFDLKGGKVDDVTLIVSLVRHVNP